MTPAQHHPQPSTSRPQWLAVALLVILFTTIVTPAPRSQASAPAHPVPDAEAIAEADQLVRQVYREVLNVRTDDERLAAATVLILRGDETLNAPAAKYVLYDTARSLAVEAGDTATTTRALDAIETHFQADTTDARIEAIITLSRKARTDAHHAALAHTALDVADRLLADGRYDDAASLLARTRTSAIRSKRPELTSAFKERPEEIRIIKAQAQRIADDLKAIETNPDNPALNLSVGKFLTLYKGDWEAGLPLLKKSADPSLAQLATLDLAGATDTAEQIVIGDRWWSLADQAAEATERRALQQRARIWYRFAAPNTAGIQRSALMQKLSPPGSVKWGDLTLQPGIKMVLELDNDPETRRDLPTSETANWEFTKASLPGTAPGTARTYLIHFQGHLYAPQPASPTLHTLAARASIDDLQINGQFVLSGNGHSRAPIRLIQGYNEVRGRFRIPAVYLEDPEIKPYVRIALVVDGKQIEIPPDHWFHPASP